MPEIGVCGHSELGLGGCMTNATWLEAFVHCEQAGARLCTRNELMAAAYTGCGLDDKLVWTWEECNHGTPGNQRVAAMGNNHKIYGCHEAYEQMGVRCCAALWCWVECGVW